jgi:sugar phosphate isomerase/epimerase
MCYCAIAMPKTERFSRRALLAAMAATPLTALAKSKQIPIGLELYSVRDELKKDLMATLRAVAKMDYECVEFYAPYYEWTPDYAKEVRKQLDDVKLQCYSTHNSMQSFTPDGVGKAVELNNILGARYIVMAHPGNVSTLDQWKQVAETLNRANDTMQSSKLHAGYHNHDLEWKPVEGQKPIELLAHSTDKSIMLQLDVGTCLETGNDPVAWIESNPGRIRSLHLKEWSPDKGYKALFGEGIAPWKKIFAAAEKNGGVEYYLIEQEGSRFPELETADRCLVAYHDLRKT